MKKFLLLLVALTLIATPSTVAYFNGLHSFSYTYNSKSCTDCHLGISNEISRGTTFMNNFTCDYCHPFISTAGLNKSGHIATNNACNDCHRNVDDEFLLNEDSHKNMYLAAINDYSRIYANEACFFCHSDMNKSIDYSRPEFIEFDVSVAGNDWVVQNMTAGNYKNYRITFESNSGIHATKNGVDAGCTQCHTDITTSIVNGGHYPVNGLFHTDISVCNLCHDNYNMGTKYQHVSKNTACVGCHATHTGNISNSINNYPGVFEGNICNGCHNNPIPYSPSANSTTGFKVYLEPRYEVIIT